MSAESLGETSYNDLHQRYDDATASMPPDSDELDAVADLALAAGKECIDPAAARRFSDLFAATDHWRQTLRAFFANNSDK